MCCFDVDADWILRLLVDETRVLRRVHLIVQEGQTLFQVLQLHACIEITGRQWPRLPARSQGGSGSAYCYFLDNWHIRGSQETIQGELPQPPSYVQHDYRHHCRRYLLGLQDGRSCCHK
jgi:hypothetical protein